MFDWFRRHGDHPDLVYKGDNIKRFFCHYYDEGIIIIIIQESAQVKGIESFTASLPAR